jgi:hypothetical protein
MCDSSLFVGKCCSPANDGDFTAYLCSLVDLLSWPDSKKGSLFLDPIYLSENDQMLDSLDFDFNFECSRNH